MHADSQLPQAQCHLPSGGFGYSTIAIGVSGHEGKQPNVEYNLDGYTRAKGLFGIFNSLGTIAFAYGGHNVVMEIQATIPSRPTAAKPNPTCAPMMVSSSPPPLPPHAPLLVTPLFCAVLLSTR